MPPLPRRVARQLKVEIDASKTNGEGSGLRKKPDSALPFDLFIQSKHGRHVLCASLSELTFPR
jgi:hypothetical protein